MERSCDRQTQKFVGGVEYRGAPLRSGQWSAALFKSLLNLPFIYWRSVKIILPFESFNYLVLCTYYTLTVSLTINFILENTQWILCPELPNVYGAKSAAAGWRNVSSNLFCYSSHINVMVPCSLLSLRQSTLWFIKKPCTFASSFCTTDTVRQSIKTKLLLAKNA